MEKKLTCAIILARSGSKEIKNKNIIDIKGQPLLYYTAKQASLVKQIDIVFILTDSKKYLEIISKLNIKKVKGMKTKIIGDIFDKLPLPIQFGMLKKFEAILIDELGKYPNETRGLDINNIYELIRDTPKIVGRTEWTNRSWREKF